MQWGINRLQDEWAADVPLFFVQERKMKGIFNREKNNIVNLKVQITKLSKGIVIRYLAFVIFVIIISKII